MLTPRLSSLWLGLVTPLYARVGRKLIDSIRHPTVVRDDAAARVFAVRPRGLREAIASALRNEDARVRGDALVRRAVGGGHGARTGSDMRFGQPPRRLARGAPAGPAAGGLRADPPHRRPHCGWYFADWLWTLRGFLDLLAGGVGMRRGRPDPERLRVGDTAGLLARRGATSRTGGSASRPR